MNTLKWFFFMFILSLGFINVVRSQTCALKVFNNRKASVDFQQLLTPESGLPVVERPLLELDEKFKADREELLEIVKKGKALQTEIERLDKFKGLDFGDRIFKLSDELDTLAAIFNEKVKAFNFKYQPLREKALSVAYLQAIGELSFYLRHNKMRLKFDSRSELVETVDVATSFKSWSNSRLEN